MRTLIAFLERGRSPAATKMYSVFLAVNHGYLTFQQQQTEIATK